MNIEVTVKITVEAGNGWNFRVNDALRDIGSEIYHYPEYIRQTGEGTNYTYNYQVKGEVR